MWAAAVEMLNRGVDILATDDQGHTALDALVERAQAMEITNNASLRLENSSHKVQFIQQSRLYQDTPGRRRMLLDKFLSVC